MEYIHEGAPETVIDAERMAALLDDLLARLGTLRRALLVPPDFTRFASGAGAVTGHLYQRLAQRGDVTVLPALGTHAPLTLEQRERMFPGIPASAFRGHDWRGDLARLGDVPAELVREISGGRADFPIACAVNRLVTANWDRIISVGQLVPHEVAGIAGHSKNVFIGLGGSEAINKTHFVGAVCGMEQALGRADAPVRRLLDYMARRLGGGLPVCYVLTVRGPARAGERAGDSEGDGLVTRGVFVGDDRACFERGAALCREVNITWLERPLSRVVVRLDPDEYHSTWLGNKAIYRTRLAIADGGELIVLAPGVRRFGEDAAIDQLIRRYGYRGTAATLQAVQGDPGLRANLAAAAHLIHGSSEGRFRIIYCPGMLARTEVEGVGYGWHEPAEMEARYRGLADGWQRDCDGEPVYVISRPGTGLWALRT